MIRDLKVPVGLAIDGTPVLPADARKDVPYSCPECGGFLVPKQGEILAWHFAHRTETTCSGESAEHKGAIAIAALAARQGKFSVLVPVRCLSCGHRKESRREFRPNVDGADTTDKCIGNTCRLSDANLTREGTVVSFLEIRKTHAVPQDKADVMPMTWFEIEASVVLGSPPPWTTVNGAFLGDDANSEPVVAQCADCERQAARERDHAARAERIRARRAAAEAERAAAELEWKRSAERRARILAEERAAAEAYGRKLATEKAARDAAERERWAAETMRIESEWADDVLRSLYTEDLVRALRRAEYAVWEKEIYPRAVAFDGGPLLFRKSPDGCIHCGAPGWTVRCNLCATAMAFLGIRDGAAFTARIVYGLLGRDVRTPRGCGVLLQAFDSRCMIAARDRDGLSKTGFFVFPTQVVPS